MPIGPGKYDDLCTDVRERSKAHFAAVIIVGGELGSGFAVQGDMATQLALPDMLEKMARDIRQDIAAFMANPTEQDAS